MIKPIVNYTVAALGLFVSANAAAFSVNVTITNNTPCTITTGDAGGAGVVIAPSKSASWSTSNPNDAIKILFTKPGVQGWYMQGGLNFGPTSGVYVDRGWMAANDQTISMTAVANSASWTQTANGGEGLLKYNQFPDGGSIALTFNSVAVKK